MTGRFVSLVSSPTLVDARLAMRFGIALLIGAFALPAATLPSAWSAEPTVAPITVPDGEPSRLLEFIAEVKRSRPTSTEQAEVLAHEARVRSAVVTAAEKIAAQSNDEKELTSAVSEKLSALLVMRRLNLPEADARLKTYLSDLARDTRPFIPPLGRIYSLATRLQELDYGNHAEVEKLVADVRAHVEQARHDGSNLSLAYQTALAAERAGLTKLAAEAYAFFATTFATSEDPAVVENAGKLAAAARLLTLPGNPMPLEGKQFDGSPFDAKQLEGKTVLVEFWATWCGPCVAELPMLKDVYSKYHERGFEIVGISLDDDRRRLDDFLKREELPWTIIFGDDPKATGWNMPPARQYGIMSLPRSVLIDKTGKVVSIDAYGETLWELLAKEIGPAVVKKPDAEGPAAVPKDDVPKDEAAGNAPAPKP